MKQSCLFSVSIFFEIEIKIRLYVYIFIKQAFNYLLWKKIMNTSSADLSLTLQFLLKTIPNPHIFPLANPSHNNDLDCHLCIMTIKQASAWRE